MKRRNLTLILLGAFWLAVGRGYTCADEEPGADKTRAGRIVHAWDGCTMWSSILNVDYNGPPNREIPGPAAQFSQRILEELVDEELSIGDYVLTNGALATAVICDAIIRLLPGALGDERSPEEESFSDPNLLEAPAYTKPADFRGFKVPDVLLSGHHGEIDQWKREQALARTRKNRPDLLEAQEGPPTS